MKKYVYRLTYTPVFEGDVRDEIDDDFEFSWGDATIVASDAEDAIEKIKTELEGETLDDNENLSSGVCKELIIHTVEVVCELDFV